MNLRLENSTMNFRSAVGVGWVVSVRGRKGGWVGQEDRLRAANVFLERKTHLSKAV